LKSPGDGLPPYELENVVGRALRHPLGEDSALTFEHLEELLPHAERSEGYASAHVRSAHAGARERDDER
jgi:hypothetical protein